MIEQYNKKDNSTNNFYDSTMYTLYSANLSKQYELNNPKMQISEPYLDLLPNICMRNCYEFINRQALSVMSLHGILNGATTSPNYICILVPDHYNKEEFLLKYKPSNENTEIVVGRVFREYYDNCRSMRIITAGCKEIIPKRDKIYILIPEAIVNSRLEIKNHIANKIEMHAFFYRFWTQHKWLPFYATEFKIQLTDNNLTPGLLSRKKIKTQYKGSLALSRDLNTQDEICLAHLKTVICQQAFEAIQQTIRNLLSASRRKKNISSQTKQKQQDFVNNQESRSFISDTTHKAIKRKLEINQEKNTKVPRVSSSITTLKTIQKT